MPHTRNRHALNIVLKRLKFSPVLAIQGARQTGKSFLVRELLPKALPKLNYETFDRRQTLDFASSNPETFLEQHTEAKPLAIDEAQKVPAIFDAIKYSVDQQRRPGRFILLGSTEFSRLSLIRESLTGRISRIWMFSLNIAEALNLPPNDSSHPFFLSEKARVSRKQWLHHLECGGMPAIFAVRDRAERETLLRDWIELTAQRDALMFRNIKIDPDLCMRIFEKVAVLEQPDAGSIARSLKRDPRRVKTHLQALTALFALHVLPPHPLGTGKPLYFHCDVALARVLGADFERQLYCWAFHELLSQSSYRDLREGKLYYYRTTKGSLIHFILESEGGKMSALKLFSEESISKRDIEILKAFGKKADTKHVALYGLGSGRFDFKAEQIKIYPWESIG